MTQESLFSLIAHGTDLCHACGADGKVTNLKLDALQMREVEAFTNTAGRFGNLQKWEEAKPVCKGCIRKLRKAGIGPDTKQEAWKYVKGSASEHSQT